MKRFRVSSATSVVLLMLCIMYFITYLDRVNVSTAAAGFGREFQLSHTEIGLVFSAFAYPYLIFQVIGGWISDRFGARRTLLACGVVWAAGTILTGMAGGLVSLIVARVILGFGEGATFPASTSAMSRWVAKERRGFAQGITHAASRIGNAVAPAVVVVVMANYGWRASFYVCGVLSLLWVVLWALSFTEHPKDHPRITTGELAILPPPKAKAAPVAWGPLFRRMLPVTIVYFCYGWTLWLFLGWIPQYFLHNYHLNLKHSALFSSTVFFAGVLGDSLGGVVTDRIYTATGSLKRARSWMVSICMLCAFAALVPLMLFHNLEVSIISLSAGFFFSEMTIGPMWAVPMDIAPHSAGTASGMMNTGSALAAIISPVVGGFLIDRFGNWQLPFIGSMVLMACGVVLAFRMQPERRFDQEPGDAARAATGVKA
jgi:ACS family glucarate transporter-like MFS transporter